MSNDSVSLTLVVGSNGAERISRVAGDMEDQKADAVGEAQVVWRAVILQAMVDACSESKRGEDQMARIQACAWLKGNSKDFATVATLAGWTPEFVREQAAKALSSPLHWRRVAPNKLSEATCAQRQNKSSLSREPDAVTYTQCRA